MENIPLKAKVECSDGPGGQSTSVIIDPIRQTVTHLVIQDDNSNPPVERLVPIENVAGTTSDLIRLTCTRDELVGMEAFVQTRYVEREVVRYDSAYYLPYLTARTEAAQRSFEEHRIPPGELALHRGATVEATDGPIGRVDGFVVEPESFHITHFALQEGHPWGKKEIILPVSAVERVFNNVVHLKLSKQAVEALPAVPVKRHYSPGQADNKQIELLARVFDNPDKAGESLAFLQDLQRQQRGAFKLRDAAVLVRDKEGNTSVRETADLDAGRGRVVGAVTGGLVGLLGGPVGAVIGAVVGAGTGGAVAKRIDVGLSDEFLKQIQAHLQPGSSALIVIVEHRGIQDWSSILGTLEGVVVQQTLTDEMVAKLIEAEEADTEQ